jgi:hypothetical protein
MVIEQKKKKEKKKVLGMSIAELDMKFKEDQRPVRVRRGKMIGRLGEFR